MVSWGNIFAEASSPAFFAPSFCCLPVDSANADAATGGLKCSTRVSITTRHTSAPRQPVD